MGKFTGILFAALAALFAVVATPASAQATRTWVSGVGDDANPCSRTAPCRTFAGSISKTAAGGEINCLDPGAFGAVTITKALTIRCVGVEAGILVSGTNGIIINAGLNDNVVLDGLDIQGFGTGLNGIRVLQAGNVTIRNSLISGFTGAGVQMDSANKVILVMENSTITSNNIGLSITATAGVQRGRVFNSLFAHNTTAGISVDGTGKRAEVSNVVITNSTKGLSITNGALVISYGDNVLGVGDAPTVVPKG